jgi:hypothetical protein
MYTKGKYISTKQVEKNIFKYLLCIQKDCWWSTETPGRRGKRRNTWVPTATRQHIRSGAKRLHRIQKKHAKVMLCSCIQTVCDRKLEREGKIKMKAK